jgi:glc operon protein GlcG
MALTLAEAQRIVDGAIAEARKRHAEISVTVCNAEGRLIALNRMDGAAAEANGASIGKAIAAAAFGRPSDTVEASVDVPLRTGTVTEEGFPIERRRGGLPIIRGGTVEGACGIDGAGSDEQDEACARAGLAMMVDRQDRG